MDLDAAVRSRLNADIVQGYLRVIDAHLYRGRHCVRGPDSCAAVVLEDGTEHVHRGLRGLVQGNVKAVRGETKNVAIFHVQVLAGEETDAVDPGTDSVDPQVSQ